MTRDETVKIIRIMVDSYPNYKPNDLSETVDVWCMMLEEFSYQEVSLALKSYIMSDNSGFAPGIGKLVNIIHSVSIPDELNEMEAWALVSKAIRNSGYNSVEEFAKLPPLVQKAVGIPGQLRTWALDENYNEGVVMSNFQRAYNAEVKRARELQKMPQAVRDMISNTNENSYKGQIEQKRRETIRNTNEIKQSEIKALEAKIAGVPMPDRIKKRLEDMKNGK